ncbi:MAG TPA: hypothetical protein VJH03_21985 [Blastocatellia bacterium]|nr:hypothetical protein [Blastocatellia bacterium]
MRKRFVLAAVCIVVLPIGFSVSQGSAPAGSPPFAVVVFAGHTHQGTFCECGTSGCACDPGEFPIGNGVSPSEGTGFSDHDATPVSADGTSDFDLGSGALMLALAFMLWIRRLA